MGCNCDGQQVAQNPNRTTPGGSQVPGKKSDKIIFGYWDVRGIHRGNGTRYLLNYCGANYEEKRYEFGTDQWQKAKASNFMDFPNVPYIIDGGFKINERAALHQYIADKYKPELLGSNPQESARIKQMDGVVDDLMVGALKLGFRDSDQEIMKEAFFKNLKPLVDYLGNNDFLCNNRLSAVDFSFFEMINYS